MPVPLKLTVCGLPAASSVMTTVPVRKPVTAGVKVTLIVQLAAAGKLAGQLFVWANSTLGTMLVIVSAAVPELVRMTDAAAEVVLTTWLAKVWLVVLRLTAGAVTGAVSRTSWKALQALVIGSVPTQKRRFSMFQSVSMPSSLPKGTIALLNATVTLPSALKVVVYRFGAAEYDAVSQLVVPVSTTVLAGPLRAGQSPARPVRAEAPMGVPGKNAPGPTISRVPTN